jgi:hypothetical protein
VLLELITSLKPLDFARGAEAMALPLIRTGNVDAVIDPQLVLHEDASGLERIVKEIHGLAELASHCLANHKSNRPSMKEVVAELLAIKGIQYTDYRNDLEQVEGIEMVSMIDESTPNSTSTPKSKEDNPVLTLRTHTREKVNCIRL